MYSREEVYKNTLEYFQGDTLATNVWIDKYALKDQSGNLLEKTPDDMHKRLAKEFARIENNYKNPLKEEEIYQLLKDFKYIVPQGSPMAGIGNNSQIMSISNCFYVDHKGDSYNSISDVDHKLISVFKRRGGCGVDISGLRPKGSSVKNAALSSTGAVSFAERYSNTAREVGAEGRRAALMISMSIKHPDIEDFIDSKLEKNKITGANISIKVTNEFMEAVKNDSDFIQTFPIDLDIQNHIAFMESWYNNELEYNKVYPLQYKDDDEYKGCYAKIIKAKTLWDKISKNVWNSAEPGILFWDKFKEESPSDGYEGFELQGVNPCVSGDTLILTKSGYKRIDSVINKNIDIWNGYEWSGVIPKITGYNQPMLKIKFSDGRELKCTDYHKFHISVDYKGNSIIKKAINLSIGDKLIKHQFPIIKEGLDCDDIAYSQGFYSAEGNVGSDIIWVYDTKYMCIKDLNGKIIGKELFNINNVGRKCVKLNFDNYDKDFVPFDWDLNSKIKWLSGLFDGDGTELKEGGLQLVSVNFNFLSDLQYLLSTIGIQSKIVYGEGEGYRDLPDGNGGLKKYYCNESWRICIGSVQMQDLKRMGLSCNRMSFNKTPNRDASQFVKVIGIDRIENEDIVYCFNEPKKHLGVFNGIITGQCSELSLSDSESCRLLSINLYSYVNNPFTKNSKFDFNLFKEHTLIAQKLLDDMIDLEIEKVDKIIEKIKSDPEPDYIKQKEIDLWLEINRKTKLGRRTGLGITAEGDMLASLGLRYGSEEAIKFSEKVHKIMAIESYISSIYMAEERGVFPIWNAKKEEKNPFISRVLAETNEDILYKYNTFGRRNIANLTIAPTGTTSLMTQTTSGIEPVFMPVYKRRRKVSDKDLATFIDDSGDIWEEYRVFHHKFVEWYSVISNINDYKKSLEYLENSSEEMIEKLVKESPYYKATSADVDYMGKVEMQGRIQKWIDHSISVTVNMPEDVTEEIVSDVYMKAWESGCKGVTVYREGSRSGVLISEKKKESKLPEERPKEVSCDINHLTIQGVKWIVLVGKINNKPYEVFCLKNRELPKKYTTGKVVRVKSKVYDLQIDDDGTICNITGEFDNPLEGALTRQISLNLKNTPLEDIYIQLQKEGNISDFNVAISRVFKKYLKNRDLKDKCPDCGSNLSMESGCVLCHQCGYSLC